MDTLIHIPNIPDTLKILSINSSTQSFLEWKTLIAVLLGGSITILGNYIILSLQRKSESRKAFFEHHISAYKDFSSLCWKGHSLAIKDTDPRPDDKYPIAYEDYDTLNEWLNQIVSTFDKNFVLIDNETYELFRKLNSLIISHIKFINTHRSSRNIDILTRNIGRDNVDIIQQSTHDILVSCRKFLRITYNAPLPDFNF